MDARASCGTIVTIVTIGGILLLIVVSYGISRFIMIIRNLYIRRKCKHIVLDLKSGELWKFCLMWKIINFDW